MNKKHQIPTPALPHKRREALPWQQPKATEEDSEALLRVQAILNSPSYRRADNDSDFLARDGVRYSKGTVRPTDPLASYISTFWGFHYGLSGVYPIK